MMLNVFCVWNPWRSLFWLLLPRYLASLWNGGYLFYKPIPPHRVVGGSSEFQPVKMHAREKAPSSVLVPSSKARSP